MHALYVYIVTSYAVEQNLQPVITVARMWAASITSVALHGIEGRGYRRSIDTLLMQLRYPPTQRVNVT